jgi:hypothetical protein
MKPRLIAIVADIHGNLKALKTVLDEIRMLRKEKGFNITDILCIGDIFGYGKDQVACYDIAKQFTVNRYGNNDDYAKKKLEDPSVDLTKFRVSPKANAGVDQLVRNLLGKISKRSSLTGFQLTAPAESLQLMQQKNYISELTKQFIAETNASMNIPSPELRRIRLRKTIPKKILDETRGAYITKIFYERPDLLENFLMRISRRNKVLEIYNFLTELEQTDRTFEFDNAIFVHDNPLNPGDGKYLVDRKTAGKLKIDIGDRAKIIELTKERFPGKEYVFVAHNHAQSRILKLNDPRLVPYIVNIGSVAEPRPKERKGEICYTLAELADNRRIIKVLPRILRAS